MDEASKGLRIQGQTMKIDSRSEEFWSSSAFEIDHSAAQSHGSISSTGISNHPCDPQSSAGSQIHPPEYVNHGLLLWNQTRQQWVGNRRPENQTQAGESRLRFLQSTLYKYQTALQLFSLIFIKSWNDTYGSLLGTNKHFPQPIPLGEMVDFLVDIWELEGMYD
ncbi:uncharacterized protein LOC133287417 isoform X2 [Gastrolobium bilobum]|nr:uncharacterized protein LOC133287417 isoform X2 [Gastrolobium bilobum]XP_061341007.1 uncharacterized protein LOC133287417 isoform X2 [Gastrolobium bilobum]XP_061341008.1 uncharacterized protein LOC133287417 isoform X2 [Gastrolobium bilobum]XP_061341009.1 uncharacterized protein LOC133287417 isoform X2 [Gastrolobium bilobum]XP_061341011.1 uncharacterized protein LOC133287417 isoform X2 [Gastrolobium bilobum]XP_061341012.1 uncharacterized protein LOC133287417 isoform X2 [Gastrolobium bilobum]